VKVDEIVKTQLEKCIHCAQLILRKISKTDATCRRQILRLKCTKFNFRWGSASDPAGGAYSAPTDPLAVFKGLLLKGGANGQGNERGSEREGGRGGKGVEREEREGMGACTHWDFRKSAPMADTMFLNGS